MEFSSNEFHNSKLTIKRLSSGSAPGEVEGGWAKTELSSGKSVCFEYHSFNNAKVMPLEIPPRFRNLELETMFKDIISTITTFD